MENPCALTRSEKRKRWKRKKRKIKRQAEARSISDYLENLSKDPNYLAKLKEDDVALEEERRKRDDDEQKWLKREEEIEEEWRKKEKESSVAINQTQLSSNEEDDGLPEIIWQGNEIIVRKKKKPQPELVGTNPSLPTTNPEPPKGSQLTSKTAPSYASFIPQVAVKQLMRASSHPKPFTAETQQGKVECPFFMKTGACQFGGNCSRLHSYPSSSTTLLVRNMFVIPGSQSRGRLSAMSESEEAEIQSQFNDFFLDVHPEFLKFGPILNLKGCRNLSAHLAGNVYVQYLRQDSAKAACYAMQGRFFASRQLACELVPVSTWCKAICGQYIRARDRGLSTAGCSRGHLCNFLHPLKNPGNEYGWADWDEPPPRSWLREMRVLFGNHFDEEGVEGSEKRRRNRASKEHQNDSRAGKEVKHEGRSREVRREEREMRRRTRSSWRDEEGGSADERRQRREHREVRRKKDDTVQAAGKAGRKRSSRADQVISDVFDPSDRWGQ